MGELSGAPKLVRSFPQNTLVPAYWWPADPALVQGAWQRQATPHATPGVVGPTGCPPVAPEGKMGGAAKVPPCPPNLGVD